MISATPKRFATSGVVNRVSKFHLVPTGVGAIPGVCRSVPIAMSVTEPLARQGLTHGAKASRPGRLARNR